MVHRLSEISVTEFSLEASALIYGKLSSIHGVSYGEIDVKRFFVPNVEHLDLSKSKGQFVYDCFQNTEEMKSLDTLVMRYGSRRSFCRSFTDPGVLFSHLNTSDAELAEIISKCSRLRIFSSYWNDGVGNLTLAAFVEFCSSTIEILDLAGDMGTQFEQPAFNEVISKCRKLKDVNINWNYGTSLVHHPANIQ
jgi:hypothetical protein